MVVAAEPQSARWVAPAGMRRMAGFSGAAEPSVMSAAGIAAVTVTSPNLATKSTGVTAEVEKAA